jgi:ParB family chromosome partitioning protein
MPSNEYVAVALRHIRPPSHQLREAIDREALGVLADSLAAEGLHQPIGLRGPLPDGAWEIIFGHRRFLAAQLLRWPTIPARLYPLDTDAELVAVTENLQRADMTPLEEARAIARFIERGESDAAIARLFRRSPTWVSHRRALLEMPEDLQRVVHEGVVKLGVAAALCDIDFAPYRAQLIQEAQRTGATVQTAELWRQHFLADKARIIGNTLTVEEIAERREAWKIVVACDLCRTDHDYQATRALRVCLGCMKELARAVHEAEAEARTAAEASPA